MSTEPNPDSSQDVPLAELAQLRGDKAPADFGQRVEETIARRSDGRFFGKRSFSERLPLVTIAVLALILALAILFLVAEPL